MHSGLFGCLTKRGAKRGELVQRFVPRSRVGIFRNERVRSTPFDLKLTFWCVRTIWVHLGLFGCLTKLGAKRAEVVQKFVPRSRVGIFRNECTQSTPLYPKLTFWCILHYFRCIRDRLVALRNSELNGRTTAKVRATKSHRNFLQRMHSIHPIGTKVMFWSIS